MIRWVIAAALSIAASAAAQDATFVLRTGENLLIENRSRAAARFTPCSTFKIPNSLIALETKVAGDPEFPLAYDPVRDGDQHGAWSRDHTLRTALASSAGWYYREIARRIGPERMRDWVRRFNYGNMATTPGVDRFWLGQDLRVSAAEQADFLQRFHENRLPVSHRSAAAVRDMLLLETGPGYRWYGKTGTCQSPDHGWVAWHVGFVERDAATSYYALNLGGKSFAEVAPRRTALIREKLSRAGLVAPQPPSRAEQMRVRIEAAIGAFPGAVTLFAKNLDSGETFGIRPDEKVRAASTIKLAVMAAVFDAVAKGRARWDETAGMGAADKVAGSGIIRELSDGTKFTVRDLVHAMIVVSDNTATNLLIERFTADAVNEFMDTLDLPATRSMRKVMGRVASGHSRAGLLEENRRFGLGSSTPREMVTLVEKLAQGELVSREASGEMLAILGRQQYKDGIGRHLPDDWVFSKSGSLDRLRSDVGLVRSTGGRIAIAVTVDDMLRTDYSPDNAGNLLIGELAAMLLDGLSVPVHDLGEPERVVTLDAAMDHVQGIHVAGNRLWVSWVDRKGRTGHLGEFDGATGRLVRSVPVQEGDRFHPGGIAGDGNSIWVPVAEYRRNSSATVQKRNRDTLALEASFEVADHIGCIAASADRLFGGNWDSQTIYTWDKSGKQIEARPNTAGTSYQDLKYIDGKLLGSGLRGSEGAIDVLDPATLNLVRRIRAGKSNRGVILTHEGMAIHAGRLYLLPEDGPSRLFVYRLPY